MVPLTFDEDAFWVTKPDALSVQHVGGGGGAEISVLGDF